MADLSKRRERERLPVRRGPHYMKLGDSAYVGFRRGSDTWSARFRDRAGEQHYRSFDGLAANDYEGAKAAAEAWFDQMNSPARRSAKRASVRAAVEAYVEDLERHGRAGAAKDATWRFELTLYREADKKPAALGNLPLERVTRDDFLDWREGLLKGREPRTVNRYARSVSAALNWAVENGYVGNAGAWKLKALADDVESDGDTAVFLSAAHRKALISTPPTRLWRRSSGDSS